MVGTFWLSLASHAIAIIWIANSLDLVCQTAPTSDICCKYKFSKQFPGVMVFSVPVESYDAIAAPGLCRHRNRNNCFHERSTTRAYFSCQDTRDSMPDTGYFSQVRDTTNDVVVLKCQPGFKVDIFEDELVRARARSTTMKASCVPRLKKRASEVMCSDEALPERSVKAKYDELEPYSIDLTLRLGPPGSY